MEAFCPLVERVTQVEPTEFCRNEWQVVRCTETGFVFLKDPPPYEALEEDLAWEDVYANEKRRRWQAEPIVSRLSWAMAKTTRYLFPNRNRFLKLALAHFGEHSKSQSSLRIVDVGCGRGGLLVQFHQKFGEQGWDVIPTGIEVSKQLAAQTAQRLKPLGGGVIENNAISGAAELEASSTDLIIMSSFLEHEARPLQLLRMLHQSLSADGAVVLKVPNFGSLNRRVRGKRWCGFRYPDHVNYFTPSTLSWLAHEAGFECHQSFADALPFSDSMYALLTKVPSTSKISVQPQLRAA